MLKGEKRIPSVLYCITGLIRPQGGTMELYALVVIGIYFIPAIVAWRRRHHNEMAIGILNLFLGWTLIGWVIALVWACTDTTTEGRGKMEAGRG
jgi:hypothetical protein